MTEQPPMMPEEIDAWCAALRSGRFVPTKSDRLRVLLAARYPERVMPWGEQTALSAELRLDQSIISRICIEMGMSHRTAAQP